MHYVWDEMLWLEVTPLWLLFGGKTLLNNNYTSWRLFLGMAILGKKTIKKRKGFAHLVTNAQKNSFLC